MTFVNRVDAGKQLAEKLSRTFAAANLDTSQLVIVGLPRGGVPVALEVAKKFHCPLDIIVSKKLPFPGQPEYAIGAVSSRGVVVLNPDIPDEEPWRAYIQEQSTELLKRTKTIEQQFYQLSGCSPCSFENKIVVLIDDGIATGMTAIAAAETARQRGARLTIIAAPVMGKDSFMELSSRYDQVVTMSMPDDFRSVSSQYIDFSQTTNHEVVQALQTADTLIKMDYSGQGNNCQIERRQA